VHWRALNPLCRVVRVVESEDIAWLVVLRVAAGTAIASLAVAMLADVGHVRGFLAARRHVPYCGFDWLPAMSPRHLRGVAMALVALGLAMAAGYRYRASATLTTIASGYLFFLDSGYYQSTSYLAFLLVALLAWSPAADAFSLDARANSRSPRNTRYTRALFQFQVGAVYFFSGVSKWNVDWLSGRTLGAMLPDYPLARWLSGAMNREAMFTVGSWVAMLFDLLIVPLLLWRRTRQVAFVALFFFHVHNALMMQLGAVPWLMLVASTVFLPPDWPRRLGLPLGSPREASRGKLSQASRAFLVGWILVQIVVPLRRWVISGDPYFTDIGFYFTWPLRSRAKSSAALLRIVDKRSGAERLQPVETGLSPEAARRASGDPHAVWWQAHEEARDHDVAVYALASASLNGHPDTVLVDPNVDLAAASFPLFGLPPWVHPHSR